MTPADSPPPAVEPSANPSGSDPPKTRGRKRKAVSYCQLCKSDLTGERAYYQRYRICPQCSTMPSVEIGNKFQRFCQQCGRFQDIDLFQGAMRTCRERLDKHAARRRKNSFMFRGDQTYNVRHSYTSYSADPPYVGPGDPSNNKQLAPHPQQHGCNDHPHNGTMKPTNGGNVNGGAPYWEQSQGTALQKQQQQAAITLTEAALARPTPRRVGEADWPGQQGGNVNTTSTGAGTATATGFTAWANNGGHRDTSGNASGTGFRSVVAPQPIHNKNGACVPPTSVNARSNGFSNVGCNNNSNNNPMLTALAALTGQLPQQSNSIGLDALLGAATAINSVQQQLAALPDMSTIAAMAALLPALGGFGGINANNTNGVQQLQQNGGGGLENTAKMLNLLNALNSFNEPSRPVAAGLEPFDSAATTQQPATTTNGTTTTTTNNAIDISNDRKPSPPPTAVGISSNTDNDTIGAPLAVGGQNNTNGSGGVEQPQVSSPTAVAAAAVAAAATDQQQNKQQQPDINALLSVLAGGNMFSGVGNGFGVSDSALLQLLAAAVVNG